MAPIAGMLAGLREDMQRLGAGPSAEQAQQAGVQGTAQEVGDAITSTHLPRQEAQQPACGVTSAAAGLEVPSAAPTVPSNDSQVHEPEAVPHSDLHTSGCVIPQDESSSASDSSEPEWARRLREDITAKIERLEASSVTPGELSGAKQELLGQLHVAHQTQHSASTTPDVGIAHKTPTDEHFNRADTDSDSSHSDVRVAKAEAELERSALDDLRSTPAPTSVPTGVSAELTDVLQQISAKVTSIEKSSVTPDTLQQAVGAMRAELLQELRGATPVSAADTQPVIDSNTTRDRSASTVSAAQRLRDLADHHDQAEEEVSAGGVSEAAAEAARERAELGELQNLWEAARREAAAVAAQVDAHTQDEQEPEWATRLRQDIAQQLAARSETDTDVVSSPSVDQDRERAASRREAQDARDDLDDLKTSVRLQELQEPQQPSEQQSEVLALLQQIGAKVDRLESDAVTPETVVQLVKKLQATSHPEAPRLQQMATSLGSDSGDLAEQVRALTAEVRELRNADTGSIGSDAAQVQEAEAEVAHEREELRELRSSGTFPKPFHSPKILVAQEEASVSSTDLAAEVQRPVSQAEQPRPLGRVSAEGPPVSEAHGLSVPLSDLPRSEGPVHTSAAGHAASHARHLVPGAECRAASDTAEPEWARRLRDDITAKIERLEASSVTPGELSGAKQELLGQLQVVYQTQVSTTTPDVRHRVTEKTDRGKHPWLTRHSTVPAQPLTWVSLTKPRRMSTSIGLTQTPTHLIPMCVWRRPRQSLSGVLSTTCVRPQHQLLCPPECLPS
eukprot:TRINITY_DN696_c0_g1_i4.p1 TRINITY_DN696_c0_g1~~TRINITY_DN696_c0_g1_i4.p1  ORF type:complete len:849 (+),score=156.18 TRINITY_DN696_c0_g1_i4:176-2548(+)